MGSQNPLAYYAIPLSAATKDELEGKVAGLILLLGKEEASLPVLASALAKGENSPGHLHRIAVGGRNIAEVVQKLRSNSFHQGLAPATPPKLAYLIAGYGVQTRMGEHIYNSFPLISKDMANTDLVTTKLKDSTLLDELYSEDPDILQNEVAVITIATVQICFLSTFLNSLVEPDCVMGHSIGEYPASFIAGILTTNEAIKLAIWWLSNGHRVEEGNMAVVFSAEEGVANMLEAFKKCSKDIGENEYLELTAQNTPSQCVLGGTPKAVEWMTNWCKENKVFTACLPLSMAFHTGAMECVLPELRNLSKTLEYKTPVKTYISSSTGKIMDKMDDTYWAKHFRSPVDYVSACRTLAEQEVDVVIEIGCGTTLLSMFQDNVADETLRKIKYFPIMKKNDKDISYFMDLLCRLHVLGLNVNWNKCYDESLNIPAPKQPIHLGPSSDCSYNEIACEEETKKAFLLHCLLEGVQNVLNKKDTAISCEDELLQVGINADVLPKLVKLLENNLGQNVDIPLQKFANCKTIQNCVNQLYNIVTEPNGVGQDETKEVIEQVQSVELV